VADVVRGGVRAARQRVQGQRRLGDDQPLAEDVGLLRAVGQGGDADGARTDSGDGEEDQRLEEAPAPASG